jgi:hypothetical protein
MIRKLPCLLAVTVLAGVGFTPSIHAQNTIGYVSYELDETPSSSEFDILNITGVNSGLGFSPDLDPVTSEVDLTDLSLTLNFGGGGSEVLGAGAGSVDPTYFTLQGDGISFAGNPADLTDTEDITSAILTGTFEETTITLSGGPSDTVMIEPTFTTTITDPSGTLADGDFAAIVATEVPSGPPPTTPEPESLVLFATGLAGLAGLRRRALFAAARKACRGLLASGALLALACLILIPAGAHAAPGTVKLATWTVPSSGLAGYNQVTVTASGFPAGQSDASVTLSFATSCGGTPVATTNPTAITALGPSTTLKFLIPASLATGTYFISVSGTGFASSTCAEIQVTATSTAIASCVPTSSLAVVAGTNVNAFVPGAAWYYDIATGIQEVPLEGSGTPHSFTAGYVNSCAANSTTGEVVCTENGTTVDLISGTTLTQLTSGSDTEVGFTGGYCYNCGVGINSANNTAVIAGGFSGKSGYGVQILNLSNNTFNAPFPMSYYVSEDISIDSGRNLILSPGEDGNYDLLQIGAANSLTEFSNNISSGGYDLDSAAEDCTTGIALSANEFYDTVFITDLTQAVFTPGAPGSWTAPGQYVNLNDGGYAAGVSGVSEAPGTNHLGVITGEFGGSAYSAIQLPATSGSGTPTLADWAYVSAMPNTPDGNGFSAGYDPHTVTAYTSPNTGKSYAVFADYADGAPDYLGVVDLACVLAQPRSSAHIVNGNAAACTRYVPIP